MKTSAFFQLDYWILPFLHVFLYKFFLSFFFFFIQLPTLQKEDPGPMFNDYPPKATEDIRIWKNTLGSWKDGWIVSALLSPDKNKRNADGWQFKKKEKKKAFFYNWCDRGGGEVSVPTVLCLFCHSVSQFCFPEICTWNEYEEKWPSTINDDYKLSLFASSFFFSTFPLGDLHSLVSSFVFNIKQEIIKEIVKIIKY